MTRPIPPHPRATRRAGIATGLGLGLLTAGVWLAWPAEGFTGWRLLTTLVTGGLLGGAWGHWVQRRLAHDVDPAWQPTLIAPDGADAPPPAEATGPLGALRGMRCSIH